MAAAAGGRDEAHRRWSDVRHRRSGPLPIDPASSAAARRQELRKSVFSHFRVHDGPGGDAFEVKLRPVALLTSLNKQTGVVTTR